MDEKHPEIIIIKRHSGHEEEHHGGAWKIAFADFMTAMMAFFLVLWIINATDKNTKTIIARYFNPLKLEEMAKAKKGIRQASGDPARESPSPDAETAPRTRRTPSSDAERQSPKRPQKEAGKKAAENEGEPADPAHPRPHFPKALCSAIPTPVSIGLPGSWRVHQPGKADRGGDSRRGGGRQCGRFQA